MLDIDEVYKKANALGYPCAVPMIKVLKAEKKPTEVYAELRKHSENSFLFESAVFGEKIARYSILGSSPEKIISLKHGKMSINGEEVEVDGNPLLLLKKEIAFKMDKAGFPKFSGGLVGFFSYDYVRYFEDIGSSTIDDHGHPDIFFFLIKDTIVFDHFRDELLLISNLFIREKGDIEEEYSRAVKKLKFLERVVNSSTKLNLRKKVSEVDFESNFSRDDFLRAVEKAKRYIYEGDIFQVVLSQRFSCNFRGDALKLYLVLKEINPSPYMYCVEAGNMKIIGSSPEILVKTEGNKVIVRPIAGTRPRGKNVVEDEVLAREMVNDEKERAEHVMLVDLGRNDIGKIVKFGTVEVTDFMTIEKYSHVQHIVSNVVGEFQEGRDVFDAMEATFPAGTVSGAPKVRAMQIIEELEPTERGVYAGSIGYFSLGGDMDFAITIRTIVLQEGRAYIQAGAGIVADSLPEREYQETVNKGKAMLKAVGLVE
mgnify:CR=1 FL=1